MPHVDATRCSIIQLTAPDRQLQKQTSNKKALKGTTGKGKGGVSKRIRSLRDQLRKD
jgi:hypothetical protein